jgi:hypothetical protein
MSKRMKWADVARMGEKRTACRLLVGKPEGRPRGSLRRRWVDNVKTDLLEKGFCDVHWIGLAYDRHRRRVLVNAVMTFGFHKMLEN